MILLKHFFDGAKNDLYVVIDFEKDATWMVLLENAGAYSPEQSFTRIDALSKSFFSPTETCIFKWSRVYIKSVTVSFKK